MVENQLQFVLLGGLEIFSSVSQWEAKSIEFSILYVKPHFSFRAPCHMTQPKLTQVYHVKWCLKGLSCGMYIFLPTLKLTVRFPDPIRFYRLLWFTLANSTATL